MMDLTTSVAINCALKSFGATLIRSAMDGHCLLHSAVSSWNFQWLLPYGVKIDLALLKSKIQQQTTNFSYRYLSFFLPTDKNTLLRNMNMYLQHKRNNTQFGDIIINILADALKINLKILDESVTSTSYRTELVTPKGHSSEFTIMLHRRGDHFNGVRMLSHVMTDHVTVASCASV